MSRKILRINNYKCFEDINLKLGNLTVLAGKNSVGKSSVTQALRLLRAASYDSAPDEIHLNSDGFLLGTFDEVVNQSPQTDFEQFSISLHLEGSEEDPCIFTKSEDSEECEYIRASNKNVILSSLSSCNFTYLSAERYGSRIHQTETNGHRNSNVNIGVRGEFSAEVLANNFTKRIDDQLVHPFLVNTSNPREHNALLNSNLEKWMSEIVGDINIRATRPPRLAMPFLELRRPGGTSEWQFPTNHGFGISYTLPIILAALLLDEGGILIVDSPEAHLHPAAQTEIAKFLGHIASAGRNVIIETHSDHILDGIRLSLADPNHRLSSENCIFHYLDRSETGSVIHHELLPRSDGSLPRWPKGFFDQMASNLKSLSALNRSNG